MLGEHSTQNQDSGPKAPEAKNDASSYGSVEFPDRKLWANGAKSASNKTRILPFKVLVRDVSLGGTVVEANGYQKDDRPIVVTQNFLPSLQHRGGLPVQIDADPDDNKSTNHIAVPCLRTGEIALTTTLADGLEQYYRDYGLLEKDARLITFNGRVNAGRSTGFPHFDPLSLAVENKCQFDRGYFVSTFTSPFIREQAVGMGLLPVQTSDSSQTNDKIAFGESAARYGYSVCPRVVLRGESDIMKAAREFADSPVWVKFSHAFGGDLLFKVEKPVSEEKIARAIGQIHKSVKQSMLVNQYDGATLEDVWPSHDLLPKFGGICVEQDARYIGSSCVPGEVVVNGSNLMQVNHDGSCVIHGYFRQIVSPAGEFLGSCSFDPLQQFGVTIANELDSQFRGIARYCHEELNLHGLVGVDFMLIEGPDSRLSTVMIELNGRPPISACSHIIGTEKLGAQFWVSKYVWAPQPLTSARDFEQLTFDGQNFLSRTSPTEGVIVPMYIASVFNRLSNGCTEVIIPKRWGQVLVAGESLEHCQELFKVLERNGVSFTKPDSKGVEPSTQT